MKITGYNCEGSLEDIGKFPQFKGGFVPFADVPNLSHIEKKLDLILKELEVLKEASSSDKYYFKNGIWRKI